MFGLFVVKQSNKQSKMWIKIACVPIIYILLTHMAHVLYFAGTHCKSKASLVGKTVIVTGANSGIGRTTALDLARRGARVIMACRSEKRAAPVVNEIIAETGNKEVIFMELDLSSFRKVNQFTEEFLAKETRLDVLVNNAGMIVSGFDLKNNENGIEMTLMVNHLGPFLLTQNLLGILKKSGPGSRVVTVSSLAVDWANINAFKNLDDLKVDGVADFEAPARPHLLPRPSDILWGLFSIDSLPNFKRYSNSKLANVLFTIELAKRLKGSGVTTYTLHPGAILTDIGIDRDTGKDMFGRIQQRTSKFISDLPSFIQPLSFPLKTFEEGAQTTVCCAVDEDLANESGLYYVDGVPEKIDRSEVNEVLALKFFDWTEKLVQKTLEEMSLQS